MKWLFNWYIYRSKRYKNTFLVNNSNITEFKPSPVEEIVYCFWTGDNAMSGMRSICFQSMLNVIKSPIKLITPQNLDKYVLEEFPLHPGFKNLSLVHKSDYLRCYFMHHYGGGYSDIKKHDNSWEKSFSDFRKSKTWIMGYPEVGEHGLAILDGKLGKDLRRNCRKIIGNGSYICRPHSPFTTEWYNELLKRMDKFAPELEKHPGNILGDNEGYPIPWSNILGDIFHPLCLKYHRHLSFSTDIQPDFANYR